MATGKTNKAAQTYTGPGTYYNTNDLIPVNYQITILWREGNWYHIECASLGTSKRLYVSTSDITLLSGTVTTFTPTYLNRYVNTSSGAFYGPATSGYSVLSILSVGTLVQYLGYSSNGFAFVEYTADNERNRAYFPANGLSTSFAFLVSSFCSIANSEVGKLVDPGDTNHTKYGLWYPDNGVAWCAIFASWCANQAGILITTALTANSPYVLKAESVATMRNWYNNSGRIIGSGSVAAGDLAFFANDAHVGIVVSVSGSTIEVVEGNVGEYIQRYSYTNLSGPSGRITSFGSNH